MAQLKLNPAESIADEIRKQAASLGISVNAYMAPYLNAIARKELVMVPHFPPPSPPQREPSVNRK
ncbi:hypothetical protein [Solirubrum puertoriconensis]|uniref:Uncharacterized protein n=1 Tax=Solirubrum puertoriconensis TaxID=1751427 RepID=A0A9X0HJA1_SOLP1|nr:hypothetical protein [Solirubrum puertoriconensis]KUG06884.1 hypothetical protein ASU33_06045 [Solirubrum puertoriconensis]